MNKGCTMDFIRGKKYCLRLLSIRPRTEYEVMARLRGKGYSGEMSDSIVTSLKNDGVINDLNFSIDWIDSRIRYSPRGLKMIRMELERKGVPEIILEEALKVKSGDIDEKKMAEDMVRETLENSRGASDARLKNRIFQLLLRKGFDSGLAEEVINDAMK
ncbi:MAG: regulatory protein RecX [Candidatus Omnitrophota bacterium]